MNREYHKWYSPRLNRDMELLLFGHSGMPVLVFPTSMGTFFEYEDRGMVDALRYPIESGRLMLFCVDGIDTESWYCKWAHPSGRVQRHMQYDDYVHSEVVPLMRMRTHHHKVAVTGASFGGYHCTNFALKHPDAVHTCVSMSGAFDIHQFLDGYYDENCYFNCPVDFLPNLGPSRTLDDYRQMRWVFGAGENDICLAENQRISDIFSSKDIPHWFDYWGWGAVHDWPLWQSMARKYVG